jgi:hypothetical protein
MKQDYLKSIRAKLQSMKDRKCHEDFYRLADNLIETDSIEMLPVLLNVINKYDSLSRYKISLENKLNNIQYKLDRLKDDYSGGKR